MTGLNYIFFDFAGTLVRMRPATLLADYKMLQDISKIYKLGIITGAKKPETTNILNKLKISSLFDIVITSDDTNYKKPNAKLFPNVNIAAYIGDTNKDKVFAQNAKVTFFRVNKKYNINDILKKFL